MIQFTPEYPKRPGESLDLTMDFSNWLADGVTITSCPWVCTVEEGTDLNPSALLTGSPTIEGAKVTHRVVGGLPGVTYLFTGTVNLSVGGPLIGQAILKVAAQS